MLIFCVQQLIMQQSGKNANMRNLKKRNINFAQDTWIVY